MELIQKIIRPAMTLLDSNHRAGVGSLSLLLIIQSFLDVISVASIAPLTLLIIQPEGLMNLPVLTSFYHWLGLQEIRNFSLLILSAIFIFLIAKHFLSRFIGNYKTKFIFSVAEKLSKRVIHNFYQITYPGYYNLKSSTELTRIINLPTLFAHNILLPLSVLITEGFILFLLVGILLFNNISAMLWMSVVLVPAILFYRLNRKKIAFINQAIKIKYPLVLEKFKSLYDNLVEIKLYQKESNYANALGKTHREVLEAQALRTNLLFNSVRLLENSAILCLCLLIGYFIFSGTSVENSIAQISFFAAASVRAIPSLNRIFIAFLEIKSSTYVIDGLKEFHAEEKQSVQSFIEFHHNISLKNINFGFGENLPIFRNLSMVIKKGEKIALTGKSGAGKTTLFLLLMRFLKEDRGEFYVDNISLQNHHLSAWRKKFAYVPQNAIILDDSIMHNITMGDECADAEPVRILIQNLGLESWLNELPEGLSTRLGENGIMISGGQRQRLAIARALFQNPEILLLDEITNQLDKETEMEVWTALNKLASDKTILMITHHEGLLKEFDSVYELEDGQLQKREIQKPTTLSFVN